MAEEMMVEEALNNCWADSSNWMWKTKNGEYIAIKDMSYTHINNTIRLLRNQIDGSAHDDWCYDWITAMEKELKRRNDNEISHDIEWCKFQSGDVVYR